MTEDLEQRKKDMAECPPWILNTLKTTSEKAKTFEKMHKETKLKLDKLVEGTQQWKAKIENEYNEKLKKKDQEIKELKEQLRKILEQTKSSPQPNRSSFRNNTERSSGNEKDNSVENKTTEESPKQNNQITSKKTSGGIIFDHEESKKEENSSDSDDTDFLSSKMIEKKEEDSLELSLIKSSLDDTLKGIFFFYIFFEKLTSFIKSDSNNILHFDLE